MSELSTVETVKLEARRCWGCGRWWAYERFGDSSAECPVCERRALNRAYTRVTELERSNASLRGALTKAKQRKSRAR
jgi:ribosomal protein L37AE/L43A